MTLLGEFSLWAAVLVGAWCAVISFSGRWRDRPELAATVTRSTHALLVCMLAASLALWQGLISHDFNIEYVAAYTSRNLPPYYIVSAFWAGQKGSLLFWAVV
ncbi:MAG: heme lyase CcmF/NrfE family subunit, partial [Deltaproteobacteria bacterium]